MRWLALLLASLALPAMALQLGGQAPDFKVKDVASGKTVSLSKLKGKVVLVDFWATWCGPCRMEIPHLVELQKQYGKSGLQVVGVSLAEPQDRVKAFVKSWKLNYKVGVYDPQADQGALAYAYGGVAAIPSTFLVDRDGNLLKAYQPGYHPKDEFEADIRAALAPKT